MWHFYLKSTVITETFLCRSGPNDTSEIIVIDLLIIEDSQLSDFTDLNVDEKIHVKALELKSNQLASLLNAPDFARHVTKLDVDSSPIEEISPQFLMKFVNLEWLMLGIDQMQMRPNMFEPLTNLKVLYMWCEKLSPEWFTGLTKLEELHFRSENMTSFDYKTLLDTLPSLKLLEFRAVNLKCDFLKKMMEDLKAMGKFYLVKYEGSFDLSDIRCESQKED